MARRIPNKINQVETPIDMATEMAEQQLSRVIESIMGPEKKERRAMLGGLPAQDIIDSVANMIPED